MLNGLFKAIREASKSGDHRNDADSERRVDAPADDVEGAEASKGAVKLQRGYGGQRPRPPARRVPCGGCSKKA